MKNNKGFTLIELLVVIAIIGLLSSLAVVSLNNARTKAQDARVKSDLKQISTAMELYYADTTPSVYPIGGTPCDASNNSMSATIATALSRETMCCGPGNDLTSTETLIQALPCHPTDFYYYEGNVGATSYCIQGVLPSAGGYFTCTNGSCFENTNECGDL